MKSRIAIALTIACLAGAAHAQQFRDGQPPVLTPAPAADPTAGYADVMDAFKRKYTGAKQPRVVLFWNRELNDRLAQTTVEKQVTQTTNRESSTMVGPKDQQQGEKLQQGNSTVSKYTEVVDPNGSLRQLDERTEALLRTTFVTTLRNQGVKFIDRTLAVRSTAAAQGGAMDTQLAEMRALKDKAEWLLEVVPVPDTKATLGYAFKVSLKDIRNESEITELYTPAIPPVKQSTVWVAGAGGFEKAAPPPPTTREVGYTLAIEVMGQVADSL